MNLFTQRMHDLRIRMDVHDVCGKKYLEIFELKFEPSAWNSGLFPKLEVGFLMNVLFDCSMNVGIANQFIIK